MSGSRRPVAAIAIGGAPQVGDVLAGGFYLDEQHGGAPRLVWV